MFKKIVLFSGIFLSLSVFAQEEDPRVFVVMGYSAMVKVQNPESIASEEFQKRQEAQKRVGERILEKLRDIEGVLTDWEVQNQFYTSSPLSQHRNVIPYVSFTSEKELHFTIRPMIWVGHKSRLAEALQSLNGREVSGGKFKVEEIKEVSYGLEVIFGFYNKDTKELVPLWTPEIVMNKEETLDLAFEEQKKSLKGILTSYQERPEAKLEVRHLVQTTSIYFTEVDASWLEEGFIPEEERFPQASPSQEKIMMILGLLQEAGELGQFLNR